MVDARVDELEAELAEAKKTIDELREFKQENRSLKDRVDELNHELITLSPPKVPAFSNVPVQAEATPSLVARKQRSKLLSWTTLFLVLVGVALATLPYVLNYLDAEHDSDQRFTDERGIGASE